MNYARLCANTTSVQDAATGVKLLRAHLPPGTGRKSSYSATRLLQPWQRFQRLRRAARCQIAAAFLRPEQIQGQSSSQPNNR